MREKKNRKIALDNTVTFLFLFILTSLSIALIFHTFKKTSYSWNYSKSEGLVESILTYTGLLIATLTASITAVWVMVRKKIEKLLDVDKAIEEINKTLIVSSELVSIQVPSFYYTQHIPFGICELAKKIKKHYYDSNLYKKAEDDGTLIKYVVSLYYYGNGDFYKCIDLLEEITTPKPDHQRLEKDRHISHIDDKLLYRIYERLGICYRNINEWNKSIECFNKMEEIVPLSNSYTQRAEIGKAITHFRKHVRLGSIGSPLDEARNIILSITKDNNYSSINDNNQAFYYAQILNKNVPNAKEKEIIKKAAEEVLSQDPEDVSKDCAIISNYLEAQAICKKILYGLTKKEILLKEAIKHIERARLLSIRSEEEGIQTIYSEYYVGEVHQIQFRDGLNELEREIHNIHRDVERFGSDS